jgi:hypothetical protein
VKNGTGIWQDIIKKKYLKKGPIAFLTKSPKNSPVWNDLLKVKHIYLRGVLWWWVIVNPPVSGMTDGVVLSPWQTDSLGFMKSVKSRNALWNI